MKIACDSSERGSEWRESGEGLANAEYRQLPLRSSEPHAQPRKADEWRAGSWEAACCTSSGYDGEQDCTGDSAPSGCPPVAKCGALYNVLHIVDTDSNRFDRAGVQPDAATQTSYLSKNDWRTRAVTPRLACLRSPPAARRPPHAPPRPPPHAVALGHHLSVVGNEDPCAPSQSNWQARRVGTSTIHHVRPFGAEAVR